MWWVNMSGDMTGAVLFDRWVGKAVLGREFRVWDELTEVADAVRRDFIAAGRSVLRTVVRFWRRFAVGCTPAARLSFQKFQTRRQSILAAADVDSIDADDTGGFDGVWGAGPYCVWHAGLADAVARGCGDAAWMAVDEIAGCAACAAAAVEAAAATAAEGVAESLDGAGGAAALRTSGGLVEGGDSAAGCHKDDDGGGGGGRGDVSGCGSGDTGSDADMDDVSLDFGLEDEATVVVGVAHAGSDEGDSCGLAGAACIDEVDLDADMAFVPVTEGDSDGLLAAEVVAGAGVSVRVVVLGVTDDGGAGNDGVPDCGGGGSGSNYNGAVGASSGISTDSNVCGGEGGDGGGSSDGVSEGSSDEGLCAHTHLSGLLRAEETGGVAAVVAGMQAHVGVAAVQQEGAFALAHIQADCEAGKDAVVARAAVGVAAVVVGMQSAAGLRQVPSELISKI